MASTFSITMPFHSVHEPLDLGGAHTTILADALARYARLRGYDCRLAAGASEHGQKLAELAREYKIEPRTLADDRVAALYATLPKLGCEPDDFIRTDEARHARWAADLWSAIEINGDVYLGYYGGFYCVDCEMSYAEKDLKQPGNVCRIHKRAAESVREEAYFFRLSRYQNKLLAFYKRHPRFIQPDAKRREIIDYVQAGLSDLPISRSTRRWGLEVPSDPKHVMSAWFDALAANMTALFEASEDARFFPADVHVVGKDMLRVYAVHWPALLMAAGYDLPRQILTLGAVHDRAPKGPKRTLTRVDPVAVAEAISDELGADVLRYCLLRAIPLGEDGELSATDIAQIYQGELSTQLGHLLDRVLVLASEAPTRGEAGPLEEKLYAAYESSALKAAMAYDDGDPQGAIEAVLDVLKSADEYIARSAPGQALMRDPVRFGTIVSMLLELLEGVSVLLAPVMPMVAGKIREQLGLSPLEPSIDRDQWPYTLPRQVPGRILEPGAQLFPRLTRAEEAELLERFSPAPASEGNAPPPPTTRSPEPFMATLGSPSSWQGAPRKAKVGYDDFAKMDLRVGVISSALSVLGRPGLLECRVHVGEQDARRVFARASLRPEELIRKRVLVLCNMEQDMGDGLVSEGILLGAEGGAEARIVMVDGDLVAGMKIG